MKYILLFFTIGINFYSLSQNISYRLGDINQKKGNQYPTQLLLKDNSGGIYRQFNYRNPNGENVGLAHYNETGNEIKVNNLEPHKVDEKQLRYPVIHVLNKKIYSGAHQITKEERIYELFEINMNTLEYSGVTHTLNIYPRILEQHKDVSLFDISKSNDQSKITFFANSNWKKNTFPSLFISVYSDSLNNLYRKEIQFEELVKDISGNYHLYTQNNGDVYIYYKVEKEKTTYYRIIQIQNNGKIANTIKITPPEERYISHTRLFFPDEESLLFLIATNSFENTSDLTNGYSCTVLNKKGLNIQNQTYHDISPELIHSRSTKKQIEKFKRKKRGYGSFAKFNNCLRMSDGNFWLIGEQQNVKNISSYYVDKNSRTTESSTFYYYYNDIFVINLSNECKINWETVIYKKQYQKNGTEHLSFNLITDSTNCYFIYNDHIENLLKANPYDLKLFEEDRSSVIVATILNLAGNQHTKKLSSFEEAGTFLEPRYFFDLNENEKILVTSRKREERFLYLKLDE